MKSVKFYPSLRITSGQVQETALQRKMNNSILEKLIPQTLVLLLTLVVSSALAAGDTGSESSQDECVRMKSHAITLEKRLQTLRRVFHETPDPGIWEVDLDEKEVLLRRVRQLSDKTTPQQMVRELNHDEPKPGVVVKKMRDKTVYLRVRDPELLTQRMGSTGAKLYLARVTFSLTSLEGVERIHFSFPEGDHARPGFYSRAFFVRHFFLP
jgi:hypothetical protein